MIDRNLVLLEKEALEELISRQVEQVLNAYFSKSPIAPQAQAPRVMKLQEACDFLGISKSHCYKLTSQNRIPHSKRGKYLYFDRMELESWMLENRVKTQSEIARDVDTRLAQKGRGQR
jgi:excisionase family DNA binding protein